MQSRWSKIRKFCICWIMSLFALGKYVSAHDLVSAQQSPSGAICAISQEGVKAQWSTLENLSQGLCSAQRIVLSGEFEKDVTGEPIKVYYYKVNVASVEEDCLTKEELDAVSNWKKFSDLEISKDQSSVVYLKLVDLNGNTTYLNTGILTIDTHRPVIERFTTNVENVSDCSSGIFCNDVPIIVSVAEPMVGNSFSGIQTVAYQVFNMGVKTQQGVLYNTAEGDLEGKNIPKSWEGKFVVDSEWNNSNDVEVVLHVRDFAGNVTTKSMELKIDISRPVIQLSYDNNHAKNEKYFSENRIATITICERNFRAEDVQIQIENSESVIPRKSEWKKMQGTENLDNTKWTLDIPYTEEGDYIFDIKYCDLAGNWNCKVDYGSSVSPMRFTIDKTRPTLQVRYDNYKAKNENYYGDERVATIEIKEHNLDINDIIISLSVGFGDEQMEVPKVQGWNRNGDFHTASISYAEDGTYTFYIEVVDKAGNKSMDYVEETFCIDTVLPSVVIQGVEHQTFNPDEMHLEIICTDENYTEEQIVVTLKKYGENVENILFEKKYLEHGVHYVYEPIPREKDLDGNYNLQVKMTDRAGNCTEKTIQFSVNRFGSSYQLGEETRKINRTYLHTPVDLVVEETNVNKLISRKMLLFKNGKTILLEEGKDYLVKSEQNAGGKHQYTYTILKENFKENGSYQVSISSEDEAGNFSANDDNEGLGEIRFGIDNVKPVLVVYNLENGNVYETDLWTVHMSVKDNFNLQKVEVYLDDGICKTWRDQELKNLEESNREFSFDIAGNSLAAHHVKIVCFDEAGNESIEEISGFYVTTNRWIYLWKNRILLCGIVGAVVLAGAIIFRIVYKKRSNPLSNFEK